MYDGRTLHGREVFARVVEAFGDKVFDTVISRTVRFPETTVAGEPITPGRRRPPVRDRLPQPRPRGARALMSTVDVSEHNPNGRIAPLPPRRERRLGP